MAYPWHVLITIIILFERRIKSRCANLPPYVSSVAALKIRIYVKIAEFIANFVKFMNA